MPEVSVIIPNYNHAMYLTQRIQSVLDQTFSDIEIIILDDCSTDDSKTVIEQFRNNPKVTQIIYNNANSGSPFKQWEKGMLLAKGTWIWIAESDDYCAPNLLESLIKIANEYKRVGIAFSRSHWVDANGEAGEELAIYKTTLFKNGAEAVKELAIHCTIQNASSCIIKREYALDAIKGLGKYKACGDWIFYTRVLQCSNLVHIGQQLNYFRWYHANISSKAKERLWMTEGADVLKNINFKIVTFSKEEFLNIMKYWKWKTSSLNYKDKMKARLTIIFSAVRYAIGSKLF